MPESRSSAESLVSRAISASRGDARVDRQELPQLDLVGAAIARAARLAAAEDRARRAYSIMQRSQAAELLRAARDAAHNAVGRASAPVFADLTNDGDSDDGRVLPPTARSGGFVWRLHPAPAEAGAPIASCGSGALA